MKPDDYQDTTKSFLKTIRNNADKMDLSKTLGFKFNIYSRWEKGTKKFMWQDFLQLAKYKKWNLKEYLSNYIVIDQEETLQDQNIIFCLLKKNLSQYKNVNNSFSLQKINRIASGKRRLQFNEFLFLFDYVTNSSFQILKILSGSQLESSRMNLETKYRNTIENDITVFIITLIIDLQSYRNLSQHSDDFIAKLIGISPFEVSIRLNLLATMEKIRKNSRGLYTNINNDLEHVIYTKENSSDIHNYWRSLIHEKSQLEKLKGCHLIYRTSSQTERKVLELTNRFFNDLRQLIKEDNQEIKNLERLRVFSLTLFNPLNYEPPEL